MEKIMMEYADEMAKNAGWREREVLKNVIACSVKHEDGAKMLYLYTNQTGTTSGAVYDTTRHIWRG